MNNTDKLLRAFIEASGFEIEEETVKCSPLESRDRDFFGNYVRTDYKVTKRDDKAISIITRLLHEIETDCNGPSMELFDEAEDYINEKD